MKISAKILFLTAFMCLLLPQIKGAEHDQWSFENKALSAFQKDLMDDNNDVILIAIGSTNKFDQDCPMYFRTLANDHKNLKFKVYNINPWWDQGYIIENDPCPRDFVKDNAKSSEVVKRYTSSTFSNIEIVCYNTFFPKDKQGESEIFARLIKEQILRKINSDKIVFIANNIAGTFSGTFNNLRTITDAYFDLRKNNSEKIENLVLMSQSETTNLYVYDPPRFITDAEVIYILDLEKHLYIYNRPFFVHGIPWPPIYPPFIETGIINAMSARGIKLTNDVQGPPVKHAGEKIFFLAFEGENNNLVVDFHIEEIEGNPKRLKLINIGGTPAIFPEPLCDIEKNVLIDFIKRDDIDYKNYLVEEYEKSPEGPYVDYSYQTEQLLSDRSSK